MKQRLRKSVLHLLSRSRLTGLGAPLLRGMGAVYMLHHIRPGKVSEDQFSPNRGLTVTPEFLEQTIRFTRERGYQTVSFAEAVRRLERGDADNRFAVFTIDDGYLDNYEYALPVFQELECPFTVFVCPSIIDGDCALWWLGLEEVLGRHDGISVKIAGREFDLSLRDANEKQLAFETLYWPLRHMPENEQRQWVTAFCQHFGVDIQALCRRLAMDWDDLRAMAVDPLVTIGAHTLNHYALAKLEPQQALDEAQGSRRRLEDELGREIEFFAYPYGDPGSAGPRDFALMKAAGFTAAVTTRKGVVFPQHKHHLTALPRVSLNGEFQDIACLDALLSGSAFALHNRFRRVNVD